MKYELSEDNIEWIQSVYTKLCEKMEIECIRVGGIIPDVPVNGRYREDAGEKDITNWINGFWSGMMWQMYTATGLECYKKSAVNVEERLDKAFDQFSGLHHDVGFMWLPSAVANYQITGNERSRDRGLHAATLLAGRYNPAAKFIRAWNPHIRNRRIEDCTGWMIVDCLMNIPILYWASTQTKDPRFAYIANRHANTSLKYILREDGSCNHIIVINPENGDFIRVQEGQGYMTDSSWSRGQAWALYGFAVCAKHTNNVTYLSAAKRIANYFIACTDRTGHIPTSDFRSPTETFLPDTSAGVCAACGMLEIADQLKDYEKELYIESALNILKAIEQKYGNWDMEEDGLLMGSRGSYHSQEPIEGRSIIFGEYYYVEAILRLAGKHLSIW